MSNNNTLGKNDYNRERSDQKKRKRHATSTCTDQEKKKMAKMEVNVPEMWVWGSRT